MRSLLPNVLLPVTLGLLVCVPSSAQTAPARKIKGLHHPMASTERALVRATMKDLRGGAVVVVEERDSPILPWWSGRPRVFRLLRLRPAQPVSLPAAPWMDTSKVVSGGNPVALLYPLGWEAE